MNTLYFHIGLTKTGTTFLQKELFPKLKGINYVKENEPNLRRLLIKILDKESLIFNSNECKKEVIKYLKPNQANLISNETLSGYPYIQYRDRVSILDKLHHMFPKAKIIVGIRSQPEMISSFYNQYVQMGGVKKPKDFIYSWEIDKERPYFDSLDLETLKYSYYLKAIEDKFGRENLYIYVYEDMNKDLIYFVNGMLSFLKEKDEVELSNIRYNLSLDNKQLKILRFINIFFKSKFNPSGLIRREYFFPKIGVITPNMLVQLLHLINKRTNIPKRMLFSNYDNNKLKDYYREDNKFIDYYYGLKLATNHKGIYY